MACRGKECDVGITVIIKLIPNIKPMESAERTQEVTVHPGAQKRRILEHDPSALCNTVENSMTTTIESRIK